MLGLSVGTPVHYGRDISSGQTIRKEGGTNYAPLIVLYVCPDSHRYARLIGMHRGSDRAGRAAAAAMLGARWPGGGGPGNYVPLIGRCRRSDGVEYARLIGMGGGPR